ncbi:hypothetical protein A3J41_00750 [candidate division TM6 bacterium RIFCSPHIGHO2_12_FULL_38_8]|nr:MAG: hypothetical protein A3J41_00750 [candidate division TM6 bacterium RIFCSPHIGHO2_12_FULL_38_8]
MIPHQLQIKNFLSYGPETQIINFSNYHLICLSGKNGHGKSALLDAITWAIWGQARKSCGNSKPDAGLLHLGQKHMMVILEFEVNGQQYRVRREFLNTATKPFATLDFGIKNAEGKLTALTDKTIKDTQEKIERTIGITYESFTNSTFLRQGQSNEFSKKLPKERKEILAQILQLSKFEEQKKIAQIHARKLQTDWIAECCIAERIEQELTALATVAIDYQKVQNDLEQLTEQLKILTDAKTNLLAQAQILQKKQNEQIFLQQQKEDIEKNIAITLQDIKKIQEFFTTQTTDIDQQKLKEEEQELAKAVQVLQQAQQQKLQLKEIYLTTKEKLTEIINKLQRDHQAQEQTLTIQTAQLQEAFVYGQKQLEQEQALQASLIFESKALRQKLDHLQAELHPLLNVKQEQAQAQELFEKNKQLYQELCAQGLQIKQQITLMIDKQQQTKMHEQNICLECDQAVSHEQQQKISLKLQQQLTEAETTFASLRQQTQNLKISLTAEHTALQKLQESCNQHILLSTKFEEQNKQHQTLIKQLVVQEKKIIDQQQQQGKLQAEIAKITTDLQNIAQTFQQQLQASEIMQMQQSLITIEQQAKLINYQAAHHQQLELSLNKIRATLAELAAIGNAEEQRVQLTQLEKNHKIYHEQLKILQEKLLLFVNLEPELQALVTQEQQHEKSMQELNQTHQKMLVEKGSLEHKQKKQLELQTEAQALKITIKNLHDEMMDYQEIAKALGKDGIQALLIEQAIPEIEHETNQILARLTNNQTQIFIESLRDLKKGGSKETLDIKISDSFGLRDYEMFSGGEAFRIDFALRIGISKLLARRAGTTLQTIFIDEGFGSQDEEGLQLIMDNIYKIQDDFAKIIIVSHLPEMKEQFPVQFMIEKKRCGSTVSVVEQG